MKIGVRRGVAGALVCLLLLVSSKPSKADSLKNDAVWAGVAVGAVGAAIALGIVYAVRHKPSKTGCVSARDAGTLAFKDEADGKTYVLHGETAKINAGQRVRLSGKMVKHSDPAEFDVAKLQKTMGACPAATGL